MRITRTQQRIGVILATVVTSAGPGVVLGHEPAAVAGSGFQAGIVPVSASYARRMSGTSWRPGCPVRISDLRIIRMTYWGFDHRTHRGALMVHRDIAAPVVGVFRSLYANRFPIRRMELIEHYRASDDRSMAADNTSAFNCRPVTGTTDRFSVHSYGRAIDINPVENPYVRGSTVLPATGRRHLDRRRARPGVIRSGDPTVRAFAAAGLTWGGKYVSLKDYQHFERN